MSKEEVVGLNFEVKRTIKVVTNNSIISNSEFYNNLHYPVKIITDNNGNKIIKGEFNITEKDISYSELLSNMYKDYETNEYCLTNDQIDAETFTWFIIFTNIFECKKDHYNPPKPAEPDLIKGISRTKDGVTQNLKEVEFYSLLYKNIPLLVKLLNASNYLDCSILLYNCAYVLASYVRSTSSLDIIKHFKETNMLNKDTKITNVDCQNCDDEPIPEDH